MRIEIGSNEAGQRLDKFCRKLLKDVPLSAIYKAIRKGEVTINGSKSEQKYSLINGDIFETKEIKTNSRKETNFIKIDKSNIKVTYEDENVLLVEKWPGVLVHSDKKNGEPTLNDYVLSYLNEKGDFTPEKEVVFRPAPCNRLDKNTSGIVIFGKNFTAMKDLNEMLRERRIEKYYVALVQGRIKDKIYEAYIDKDENSNVSKVYNEEKPGTKRIAMEVKTLQTVGSYSFIEIRLMTGRSHQIRAHLSSLGNPIVGDPKYGNKKINNFFENKYGLNYQYLYAYKLIFKECTETLSYLENKTIAESLPPVFKRIKKDVFKF